MHNLPAIGKRLAHVFLLLLAVIVFNFFLVRLAPGDPAEVIAGEMGGVTAEVLQDIRRGYGLDKPQLVQLGVYLGRVAQGDLGYSYFYNTPVTELIFARLGPTLVLVLTALFFAIGIGTLLGVLASLKPAGLFSNIITVFALVGYSMPVFWTGMMLVIVFAATLGWFPISNMYEVTVTESGWVKFADLLHHLVLPAFTLGVIYLAQYARLARASMLEVLDADYIRTARAKGLGEVRVIGKHALRNAVIPVVTIAGLQFGHLISGAVLVETVFNWPGLGTLALESVLGRDYPTLLGILFFSALLVVTANLLTDLAYRVIDPRIRTGE
ncbi:MAG: ABC transporter permease [Alphaproteobacteria bacterium]|nr:ABC transporter permease [Alphaproteobacteria bacterium]